MTNERYPEEILDPEDDDGTMPGNVAALSEAVVGHRIVSAEKVTKQYRWNTEECLELALDDGTRVYLADTAECCAYTGLDAFFLDPASVDHVIMGVGTTDGYETWHVYADYGDILQLTVGWSSGNPFYYGYGFDILVERPDGTPQ
jgi:hypothetical protein